MLPGQRGVARAQFRREYGVFYALLMHFLPITNVKKQLLHHINECYVRFKQKVHLKSVKDFIFLSKLSTRSPPSLRVQCTVYTATPAPPPQKKGNTYVTS